jgi:hypothetical protein
MGESMQGQSTGELIVAIAALSVLAWIIGWRLFLALWVITQGDNAHQDVTALLGRAAKGIAAQSPAQESEEASTLCGVAKGVR